MKKNIVIYLLCFAFGFMAHEVFETKKMVSALENDIVSLKQRIDKIEVEAYDLQVQVKELGF